MNVQSEMMSMARRSERGNKEEADPNLEVGNPFRERFQLGPLSRSVDPSRSRTSFLLENDLVLTWLVGKYGHFHFSFFLFLCFGRIWEDLRSLSLKMLEILLFVVEI